MGSLEHKVSLDDKMDEQPYSATVDKKYKRYFEVFKLVSVGLKIAHVVFLLEQPNRLRATLGLNEKTKMYNDGELVIVALYKTQFKMVIKSVYAIAGHHWHY